MATSETFLGFCDDAGFFKLDDQPAFRAYVKANYAGQDVVLTVQSRSALRSVKANGYYWAVVVKAAAVESGQSENDIHTFWCEQFLPDEKKRLLFHNRLTGASLQVDVDSRRTSKLTGTPFYDYVESCRLWLQEWLGVTTPDPDPEFWRKKTKAVEECA